MAAFRSNQTDYRIVAVAELPYSHNPARCDFHEDYNRRITHIKSCDRLGALLLRRHPKEPSDVRAGRWTWEHHQSQQSDNCKMHVLSDSEFRQAADDARHIFQTAKLWQQANIYNVHVKSRCPSEPLDPATALMWSLIADPIVWDGRSPRVGNGQHRICGARVAGCTRLLVAHC